MTPPPRTLVVLLGPPAVGKMTVGRALERETGLPLFHNHMTIELVLPFFAFGSPPFQRLVRSFRRQLFEEVAASELPGLIFTWVWAFDEPDDQAFIAELKALFEAHGARVVFVELWADQETRLSRNATEPRLGEKPSKRDIAASNERLVALDRRYRLSSDGDFPFAGHLRLDNTRLTPAAAAARIIEHFELPLRPEPSEPGPTAGVQPERRASG
jgi:hypothetical protein